LIKHFNKDAPVSNTQLLTISQRHAPTVIHAAGIPKEREILYCTTHYDPIDVLKTVSRKSGATQP
jgi:hypothetical protein